KLCVAAERKARIQGEQRHVVRAIALDLIEIGVAGGGELIGVGIGRGVDHARVYRTTIAMAVIAHLRGQIQEAVRDWTESGVSRDVFRAAATVIIGAVGSRQAAPGWILL